jgi:hypothetical protein
MTEVSLVLINLGSGRPKTIRILLIRLLIRNTASNTREKTDVYLEWLSVCVEEAQGGNAELIAWLLL